MGRQGPLVQVMLVHMEQPPQHNSLGMAQGRMPLHNPAVTPLRPLLGRLGSNQRVMAGHRCIFILLPINTWAHICNVLQWTSAMHADNNMRVVVLEIICLECCGCNTLWALSSKSSLHPAAGHKLHYCKVATTFMLPNVL